MTKRHFERFAKMLREVESKSLRLKMAVELVKVFKEDNPLFNEERFRKAANCD